MTVATTRVRTRIKAEIDTLNVKKRSSLHLVEQSTKAPKAIKGLTKFRSRQRDPNEAHPPTSDLWKRETYKVGDGDTVFFQRPGSDHSHLKSYGDKT